MLYLFSGDDTKKRNTSCEAFLKTFQGAEMFTITKNDFDLLQIRNFHSGTNLFAAKTAVIFRDILENEELASTILAELPAMGESGNTFIFVERKLLKPALDAFKKARAELNVFELPKQKKEKYDNFLVANALAARDKFNCWLHFRRAVDLGVSLDELSGVMFWKVKDMLLRRNFGKWQEEELKILAARLSCLLPLARKAGPEAESAMEQFLLEVF